MESSGLKLTAIFTSFFFSSLLFRLLMEGLLVLLFSGTGWVFKSCSLVSAPVCLAAVHLSSSCSGMRRGVRTGAVLKRSAAAGGSGSLCSS